MKSKKTIVMLSVLAALCLTSCSNDDEVSVNDGAVRFTASIGKEAVATPQSRAAGTAWHSGDEIGIFMVNHGTTDIADGADNRQYTTGTGDGGFTAVNGVNNEIFYPMDNSAVDFIAYYPYADGASLADALPVEIAAIQTDASQRATDLMWAKADNGGTGHSKDNGDRVNFTFGHCLAKLTMNCKVDPSVGAASLLANATVSIKGMNTRNTFDLAAAKLGAAPNTPQAISPHRLGGTPAGFHGAFDAIILPGKYAGGKLAVDFKINGETFSWNVGPITFEAGCEYIYEVTISRKGVSATGTIVNWQPVTKDEITADFCSAGLG